jgi:hypothetical protein
VGALKCRGLQLPPLKLNSCRHGSLGRVRIDEPTAVLNGCEVSVVFVAVGKLIYHKYSEPLTGSSFDRVVNSLMVADIVAR